jgi:hypothetical protein
LTTSSSALLARSRRARRREVKLVVLIATGCVGRSYSVSVCCCRCCCQHLVGFDGIQSHQELVVLALGGHRGGLVIFVVTAIVTFKLLLLMLQAAKESEICLIIVFLFLISIPIFVIFIVSTIVIVHIVVQFRIHRPSRHVSAVRIVLLVLAEELGIGPLNLSHNELLALFVAQRLTVGSCYDTSEHHTLLQLLLQVQTT